MKVNLWLSLVTPVPCGQGVGDPEASSRPGIRFRSKDDTRRGQEGQRAHKVLLGTWEIRRSMPPEVGGGHSSDEASNDRGAKGLYIGEAT